MLEVVVWLKGKMIKIMTIQKCMARCFQMRNDTRNAQATMTDDRSIIQSTSSCNSPT